MPLEPGSDFGPYRVVEPLGLGGMSSVYRAHETALDRDIALKVLPAQFLHDPSFRERFEREAKVVAKLEHRNIVPIHAFGVDEEMPWMAMRLVSGQNVFDLRKAAPLPPRRVVAILRDVAEAIDYAHSHGVLHRDVKPQNILLDTEGHAYLADFGIARIVAGDEHATQTGAVMGTPKYMAPEQARGEQIDHRCDIYSLGVVAYELFTGRAPFSGSTPMNIAVKHIMDPVPPPDPSLLAPVLAEPVLKCLAKQADDRWDTAVSFVEALESGLKHLDDDASETAPREAPEPKTAPAAVASPTPAPTTPLPPKTGAPAAASPPPPRRIATRASERHPTRPGAVAPQGEERPRARLSATAIGGGLTLALVLMAVVAALTWRGSGTAGDETETAALPASPPADAPATSATPGTPPLRSSPTPVAASAPPATSAATLALFQRVCDEGDAASCEKLARALWEGGGRPADRSRAPELFDKACAGGIASACASLGDLYRDGDGVLRNLARAVALYDQACDAGSVQGCHDLGLLYRAGQGVAADEGRARALFEKACEAGSTNSCAALNASGG